MIFIRTFSSLLVSVCLVAAFICLLSMVLPVSMHTNYQIIHAFLKFYDYKLIKTNVATGRLPVATLFKGVLNKPGLVRDKISSSHLSNPVFTNGNERSYPEVSEPPHPSLFDLAPDGVYQARMSPYGW